jgi:hypothetical protein
MANSWKIGAVSGLIAGLIAGIISVGILHVGFAGNWNPWALDFGNISTVTTLEITLTMIWGIILGVRYSKAHGVISDRVINKGLIFGLFCGLVFQIRNGSFAWVYANIDSGTMIGVMIYSLIVWIAFGLILASLYGRWHKGEKQKIVTYDMKSGIHPGAIAGFIGGVIAYFCAVFYP